MALNADYAKRIRDLAAKDMSDTEFLTRALVTAAVWRSKLWANTLALESTTVRAGPFQGLDYVVKSAEGALLPRLLGIYERELHPDLLAFAEQGLDVVIDVGCAEGYYAVGLARLMPAATIHAFDINEAARRRCGLLAQANGVGDRVVVGEAFSGPDFERFRDMHTLVLCDAEGFEDELFRPDLYPALAGMNVIVETHPMMKPGITERLTERFAATHDVKRIDPAIKEAQLTPAIQGASHIDMMIAAWEWRAGPTPWLVMRPKADSLGGNR